MCRRSIFATALVLFAFQQSGAAEKAPSAELKKIFEGTWNLVEWPAEGKIVTPPEMDGRWMIHDGIVMAVRHRNGPMSFESSADYGAYTFTDTEWSYGYERQVLSKGPTAAEAKTTISEFHPIKMRTYKIAHQGKKLVLTATDNPSRWEFDGPYFSVIGADGSLIRKYKKISE